MPPTPIVERALASLGQSQPERFARELESGFAPLEGRSKAELLAALRSFASDVRFAGGRDWASFFPAPDADLAALFSGTGETPPHLALLLATLELLEDPTRLLNRSVEDHLDHYYREVLRLEPRPAKVDRAHVLVELKPGALNLRLGASDLMSGGKDASGNELIYAPVAESVLNAARVASLRSVYRDTQGRFHCAPMANSSDGVGTPLSAESPRWRPFGHRGLPLAPLGCAIASPLLRLAEGAREVRLGFTLAGIDVAAWRERNPASAFEAFLTGPSGWLGPYAVSAELTSSGRLDLSFTLPEAEDAVIDCDSKLHGAGWPKGAPILELIWMQRSSDSLLAPDSEAPPAFPHELLSAAVVRSAELTVTVKGIRRSLALESDTGPLDPAKPFLPFGPQPVAGSKLSIGCTEALSKPLTQLEISLQWQGVAPDLAQHYASYETPPAGNASFTATIAVGGGGFASVPHRGMALFEPANAASARTIVIEHGSRHELPAAAGMRIAASFGRLQRAWSNRRLAWLLAFRPTLRPSLATPSEPRAGFVTLELDSEFLHAQYRKLLVATPTNPPAEPYTPKLKSLALGYRASAAVTLTASTEAGAAPLSAHDFAKASLTFFHLGAFGPVREHGYERSQLPFVSDPSVTLLAPGSETGELLIGVSGVRAGDAVTLYFEVVAGSADPDLPPAELRWSVLCDNHWRLLQRGDVTRDTTAGLRRSGIISWALPAEVGTDHSLLPDGLVWLRAAVRGQPEALPELLLVATNGVEVALRSEGYDASHLTVALKAGSIAKLKTASPALKSLKQPFASFGARPAESPISLRARAAERLRHKDRCISAWDYERVVLEAFPSVRTLKCISHAANDAWLSPGHVLLIAIPDLANRNGMNRLEPKLDADTLREIEEHVRKRAPASARIEARNPRFQRVHVDLRLTLRAGYAFSVYSALLEEELVKLLSPWAYAPQPQLLFGGAIHKSALIAFADRLPYVDFVDDVRLYGSDEALHRGIDANEVRAGRPDAILVSAPRHNIRGFGP